MYSRFLNLGRQDNFFTAPLLEYIKEGKPQPPENGTSSDPGYYDTESQMIKFDRNKYSNLLPLPFPVPIFESESQLIDAANANPPTISTSSYNFGDVLGYAGVWPIFRCRTTAALCKIFYQLTKINFSATFVYYSHADNGSPKRNTTKISYSLRLGIHGTLNEESWNMSPITEPLRWYDDKDNFASKIAEREEQERVIHAGTKTPVFYMWRNAAFTYYSCENIEYGNNIPSAMPYLSVAGVAQVGTGEDAVYYILGSPYITGGSFYYQFGRPIGTLGGKLSSTFYEQNRSHVQIDDDVSAIFTASMAKFYYGNNMNITYLEFEAPSISLEYSKHSVLF